MYKTKIKAFINEIEPSVMSYMAEMKSVCASDVNQCMIAKEMLETLLVAKQLESMYNTPYCYSAYPNAKLTETEATEWVSEIGEHWDKATTDKVYAQYKDVLMDLGPILFYVMMNYYYYTLHAKAIAMGKDNVEYYVAEIKEFLHTYKMFHNRM